MDVQSKRSKRKRKKKSVKNKRRRSAGPSRKKRKTEVKEELSLSDELKQRKSKTKEPPLPPKKGFKCSSCKKITWSGKSKDIWYHIFGTGEWMCLSCGEEYAISNACCVCGKCFSDDSEVDASWIACDLCPRWVMTKCDGITDLSLYDDDNPDHLTYHCPICTNRLPQEPMVFYSNLSESSSSASPYSSPERNETSLEEYEETLPEYKDKKRDEPKNSSQLDDIFVRLEKELIDEYNEQKLLVDYGNSSISSDQLEKIEFLENRFVKDIGNLRESLVRTRNKLREQNEAVYERLVAYHKKNREHLDKKAEDDLVNHFKLYYQTKESLLIERSKAILNTTIE
eukprot:TRINITY_DN7971_c0_g1_i1.p1 TRINITY_DN7971_c0_g1~~TRINITY_DN7971_c0_g1_i1.p1  ORF type:complete len:341 (-),score=78.72 TRINITY_DN7971_c0_g1_i1:14-1036(-)